MAVPDMIKTTLATFVQNVVVAIDPGSSRSNRLLGDPASRASSPLNLLAPGASNSSDSARIPGSDAVVLGNGNGNSAPGSNSTDGAAAVYGLKQEHLIAVSVMLTCFSIFGILGNGLVLYVFSRKSDRVTSTIFILALAWADFFTCLVIMPFTVTNLQLNDHLYYTGFCKLFKFIITFGVTLSVFMMVAIAVDRYLSICHPFSHMITPKRAKISILCLLIFAMRSLYANSLVEIIVNQTAPDPKPGSPDSLVQSFANCTRSVQKMVYAGGMCVESERIFSFWFMILYQKIFISFYVISLLSVFMLYFFIYRSVAQRRKWRRRQKSCSHSPMTQMTGANNVAVTHQTNDGVTPEKVATLNNRDDSARGDAMNNGGSGAGGQAGGESISLKPWSHGPTSAAEKKSSRERRDFNFLANIRTAMMLFVVTVVFTACFVPAWLMAAQLVTFQPIVFYSHLLYNVANPVIYAFMNQSFRKELKRVFQ
ncbi:hypothetical protein EGW08_016897, partial [Elysia chlorotica]